MIDAARRAVRAVTTAELDGDALVTAVHAYDEPWRVVVVGRTGAGKTSLVNTLAGVQRPTGLGGVTRYSEEVPFGTALLVDTPGIDGAELAIARLAPELARADVAVWVVDGLQPVTDTERRVVREAMPPGTALDVRVSKLDVVGDEESDDVLARVRALTAPFGPRSVLGANPRTGALEAVGDWSAAGPTSARRVNAVRQALEQLQGALSTGNEDVLPALSQRWRQAVRGAQQAVVDDIESGEIAFKQAALRALARALALVRAAMLANLPALPGRPRLPEISAPEYHVVGALIDGLGGQEAARKAVRGAAGRLLMEGQVALQEWVEGARDPRLEAAREAVAVALATP